jgi:4-oxalomesaconate tautomerase
VPGTAAPISLVFLDVAGSSCGALLPTGNAKDVIDDIEITCIDNGMPTVLLRAKDLGITGKEAPAELESNKELKDRIEAIRLKIGPLMNLGDVSDKTVPKMTIISPPLNGGLVHTRSFIPHRVHEAIGVLGAVSVATGCIIKGSVAEGIADYAIENGLHETCFDIEHPTGFFSVDMAFTVMGESTEIHKSALLRTARKLMVGEVFVPEGSLDV